MLKRFILITIVLLTVWQTIVMVFHLPPYILSTPIQVFKTLFLDRALILTQTIPTLIETLLGFLFGALFGILSAIFIMYFRLARLWFLPILLISQAIPTFAIAPILVVWFGYGITSKIITTIIMLFFPITHSFYDGLRRTNFVWLDLAKTMNASKWQTLLHIQIPAALPSLATGLRVAAAIAPIGAIVGEWVGSSRGLGFLMLNANARLQINVMFAALLMIALLTIGLYFTVDRLLKVAIPWQKEEI